MNDDLILKNQALINYVIKQMGLLYNFEEYYDVGKIGLVKAGKTFDEDKGVKFNTYAYKCIEKEIIQEIYYRNRDKRKNSYYHSSLDANVEDSETLFYEIIDSGINIERDLIKKEKIELLNTIIAILEPKDRYMLEHYFQLGNNDKLTQVEIANRLGLDKRYVQRRIKRALRIIKKIMEDKYEKEN